MCHKDFQYYQIGQMALLLCQKDTSSLLTINLTYYPPFELMRFINPWIKPVCGEYMIQLYHSAVSYYCFPRPP